jgi:glutathione S-transferase
MSLSTEDFIAGQNFTIADCYLTVILGWCEWLEIGLDDFPNVARYFKDATVRSGVKRALGRQ